LGVFLKIDTGYHRTGLLPDDNEIDSIIKLMSTDNKLNFKGFLSHAGHTYNANSKVEILSILKRVKNYIKQIKAKVYNPVS